MEVRGSKRRQPLSHVGGAVELSGDPALGAILAHAVATEPEQDARDHVHGFHSYPARLHPLTARRLVDGLAPAAGTVLDPFCGSGTVVVEARLLGRAARGVDANPLAVQLAWLKSRGTDPDERDAILRGAAAVTEAADVRRAARAGATHRYGADDVALFDPHVLLELDSLRAAIDQVEPDLPYHALMLVLSAILVKVSRKPGDTAHELGPRRLASGFTLRFFAKKSAELVDRLAAYAERLPRPAPFSEVRLGDARKLSTVPDGSVDLVATSPPYPGNYDYLAHHEARLRWLRLDAHAFDAQELGARRHLEPLSEHEAEARWSSELSAALSAMARVLGPQGRAVLIIADSVIGSRAVYADRLLPKLASPLALGVQATASQVRPHFHAPSARAFQRGPRREHAIVLGRR